ncbi:hypothetical protein OG381_31020 [Streptomyces sp. NBC_00490]|uniref:hypothetical protein n=1 Tax=Streptomyces sp. NBC_00490 TaxID=2903657 RepID=UPI002E18C3C9
MTRRSRLWRRAVIAWAVAVVVGAGLTRWLQDSAEPPEPRVWEQSSPEPALPDGWETACPAPSTEPDGDSVLYACAFATG